MTKLERTLTDKLARDISKPHSGFEIHWCADNPGFGVRITAADARSWVYETRLKGKTARFTLGKAAGAGAISVKAAHGQAKVRAGEVAQGIDRLALDKAERAAAKAAPRTGMTLAAALDEYVKGKRRGKDGLALKKRTKDDYTAMVETSSRGLPGELYELANRPLDAITGADIRRVYERTLARGQRRAVYAMQVLRAVMNWHGVKVPDSPLGKDVAGKLRIVLPKTTGNPKPIPREYLGAWWRAACAAGDETIGGLTEHADYLRFKLLTGVRSGESKGDKFDNVGILVRDFDVTGASIIMRNTKNRKDHLVLLSRQALRLAKAHAKGKKPADSLFAVVEPRRTLKAINKAAGVTCTLHELRHTFCTMAADLVPVHTLQRMTNHAASDVTGQHYVRAGDEQLRAGWQAVADLIEREAKTKKVRRA